MRMNGEAGSAVGIRVAVIGGGIIGLCSAHVLRRQGAEVTLFESGRTGQGASKGNAGWVCPGHSTPVPGPGVISYGLRSIVRPDSPLYFRASAVPGLAFWLLRFAACCTRTASARATKALARFNAEALPAFERLRASGVSFELHNAGLLYCFTQASNVGEALEAIRAMAPYGYSAPEVLDGDGMRRFEPSLSRSVAAGFFLPQECYVDPVALTASLHRANVAEGVTIREAEPVIGLERVGARVRSVVTNAGAYAVDEVVVAAGAWTGRFLEKTLDLSLPIQAGKGYSFTVRPQRLPLRPLSFHEARVAVTPAGDRMRLAGTMEFSGINDRVDPRRIAAISSSAHQFLEGGTPHERRDEWAGMRPLVPDGLPVIGRLRRFSNVVVATGHGMLGITQGAVTGELVARQVTNDDVAPEFAAFAPSRYGA